MIDSIRLRLHDLEYHKEWLLHLRDMEGSGKNGVTRLLKVVEIPTATAEQMQKSGDSMKLIHEYVRMGDGYETAVYHRQSVRLPSSHYTISYEIKDGYVALDFSIPKALYGNNIAQFVVDPDMSAVGSEKTTWSFQKAKLYSQLRMAIRNLMDDLGGGAVWDAERLEIREIDLCYNQVFNSEQDAKRYIECQIEMKRKRKRANSNDYRRYDTAIHYTGAEYTCKIYHKGSEYKKHDRKKHELYNKKRVELAGKKAKELGLNPNSVEYKRLMRKAKVFNVERLQNFADRIVRYEIRFKGAIMNRMYMNGEFRKNSRLHQKRVVMYKTIRTATKSGERRIQQESLTWEQVASRSYPKWLEKHMANMIHKKGHKLEVGKRYTTKKSDSPVVPRGIFVCDNRGVHVTIEFCSQEEWKFMQKFENALRKRRAMMLDLPSASVEWVTGGAFELQEGHMDDAVEIHFSSDVLSRLVDVFRQWMLGYQVEKLPEIREMEVIIQKYNDEMKERRDNAKQYLPPAELKKFKGINKTKLLMCLTYLQSGIPFDELPDKLKLEPRTWRRYKKDLNEVGIFSQQTNRGNAFGGVTTDFGRYYEELDRMQGDLLVNKKRY